MSAEHEDGNDPKLRSMRAVWLQMRDEDPPESGLAELLAAARTKADTMAHPSWWQRLSAMLRRPPVFALATVMIVLGGALVIARRVEPASTPAPQLEAKPSDEPTAGRAASTEQLPPAPKPPPGTAGETPPRPKIVRPTTRDEAGGLTASPPPPELAHRDFATPPPPVPQPADTGAEVQESTGMTADVKAGNEKAEAQPEAELDGRGKALDQLVKQCETAARRGDCAAVRALVQRIEKSDRSYRARQAKDSPVGKCLAR